MPRSSSGSPFSSMRGTPAAAASIRRSISRMFDQKPTIYDPKTLIQAIAVPEAADVYLRNLHPKHPQFERLRQALLAARGVKPDDPRARGEDSRRARRSSPARSTRRSRCCASGWRRRRRRRQRDMLYDDALVAAVKAVPGAARHGADWHHQRRPRATR